MELDPLTELHGRRYFHEVLEREVARAHRYGRRVGVLVLELGGSSEELLSELSDRLRRAVRASDVPCRISATGLAVIMPESGRDDAAALGSRIVRALSTLPNASIAAIGAEELEPDETALALFARAETALRRQEGDVDVRDGAGLGRLEPT